MSDTIEAGEGYRLLGPDEIVCDGDQYIGPRTWRERNLDGYRNAPRREIGQKVSTVASLDNYGNETHIVCTYRRKISAPAPESNPQPKPPDGKPMTLEEEVVLLRKENVDLRVKAELDKKELAAAETRKANEAKVQLKEVQNYRDEYRSRYEKIEKQFTEFRQTMIQAFFVRLAQIMFNNESNSTMETMVKTSLAQIEKERKERDEAIAKEEAARLAKIKKDAGTPQEVPKDALVTVEGW